VRKLWCWEVSGNPRFTLSVRLRELPQWEIFRKRRCHGVYQLRHGEVREVRSTPANIPLPSNQILTQSQPQWNRNPRLHRLPSWKSRKHAIRYFLHRLLAGNVLAELWTKRVQHLHPRNLRSQYRSPHLHVVPSRQVWRRQPSGLHCVRCGQILWRGGCVLHSLRRRRRVFSHLRRWVELLQRCWSREEATERSKRRRRLCSG